MEPKDDGFFKEFETPEQDTTLRPEIEDDTFFKEFESSPGVSPKDDGFFSEFEETANDPKPEKPILKALGDLATAGPVGPALQGFATQMQSENKQLGGEQDPIYFNKRDLSSAITPLANPLTTLNTAGKVAAREEAAFSQPVVGIIEKLKNPDNDLVSILKGVGEDFISGLKGDTRSDYSEEARQTQAGDIYRALGIPEPLAATAGLATSLALPTSVLMNFISPGGRIISKAEGIAQNAIKWKALMGLVKKDKAALTKNKQTIIEHMANIWPEDTHIYLAKYKQDLIKATTDDDIREVLTEASKARPKVERLVADQARNKPKGLIANLATAAHEHMYFPYAVKSMLNAKSWDHPILQQIRNAQASVTHMETGINHLVERFNKLKTIAGIHGDIPEKLALEIKANQLYQEGEIKKLATLLKYHNLSTVPKLSKEGSLILKGTRALLNRGRDVIAKNYERHYKMPFKIIENHSFPLTYINEESLPLEIFRPQQKVRSSVKGAFKTRVSTPKVPAIDLDKQFIQQARAQEMLRHTVPAVDDMRMFMSQKHIASQLTEDQLRFIEDRLEFVLRGGNEIPKNIIEAGIRTGSKNVTKGMLGYKVTSAVMQPTAYIDAMNFATQTWGRGAGRQMLRSAVDLLKPGMKRMKSEAGELRLGMSGADISLKESGKGGSLGMKPLQLLDYHTARAARNGMEKYLKKAKIPHNSDDLDFFMELAQGSSNTMLQPGVMTHGYTLKAWYTFQTFVLGRWSRMAVDVVQQGLLAKNAQRRAAIAVDDAMLTKPELIKDALPKTNWVMLSANKSGRPDAVNQAADKLLRRRIKEYGYKVEPAKGGWINLQGQLESEPSYFVRGMREDDAIKIGKEMEQTSIKTPRGEIFLDDMTVAPNDYKNMKIEVGDAPTKMGPGEGFTEVTIGGKKHRISIPTGPKDPIPLTSDRLTYHVQPHNVIERRINGMIGLMYIAAAEAAEQGIRNGVYKMVTGKDNPKTVAQALMASIPTQIPVFSAMLQAAMYGGSGLPPMVSTLQNIFKGAVGTVKGKTSKTRVRNLIKAIASSTSLLGGVPGSEQVSQLAQQFVRE